MTAPPLAGRRVLVTRAAHQAGTLSEGLRALGAEPVEVPVLEIQPPESFAPLDAALGNLDQYHWLIFTSANAVRAVANRATEQGIILIPSKSQRVAAVGAATAAAIEQIGLRVNMVPESYVAECLVETLLNGAHKVSGHDFSRAEQGPPNDRALAREGIIRGQRILLARAEIARDVIPDALRAAGAMVDVVDAYRNVIPTDAPEQLRQALGRGIDAATFTSSSSVTHLANAARAAGIAFPFAGVRAVSIGPITSKTLRDLGWEPAVEADPSDIPGLVAAMSCAFAKS
jgi:uroporphyrinogen-III synthase